jgi:GNAT superfamily N-acetyltransferase
VTLLVEDLRPTHLPALRALFEAASCPCFCRYWHFEGSKNEWLDRCANRPGDNARELTSAVSGGDVAARGLVAIERSDPIGLAADPVLGWMKLAPRRSLPKLEALPVYRSLRLGDPSTTFAIACVLVLPAARGRGVARALVAAAESAARRWGARAIEGYPRRSSEPLHAEEAWQGPERLFVELGFEVLHDVGPYPVYRKRLD